MGSRPSVGSPVNCSPGLGPYPILTFLLTLHLKSTVQRVCQICSFQGGRSKGPLGPSTHNGAHSPVLAFSSVFAVGCQYRLVTGPRAVGGVRAETCGGSGMKL